MGEKSRRAWYIGFGAILTAIGTFLVTTDPIFHYADLLKSDTLDTTKVINISPTSKDSILILGTENLPMGQKQMEREIKRLKAEVQDTLKPMVKKHEEFFR